MGKPKQDADGRYFEEGMVVALTYPYKYDEDVQMIIPTTKVLKITKFNNQSKFVCYLETDIHNSRTFDPVYLRPLEYVTESLNLLYGKK